MRLLLSLNSRQKLFDWLIKKHNCRFLTELSKKMNIQFRTIQNWRYCKDRYIPSNIIPMGIEKNLEIIDKQEDNWGKIKGGKETYKLLLQRYGIEEIRRRQSKGGKKSIEKRESKKEPVILDITNPLFLEFYGVLLGDGWMSKLKFRGKINNLIGISGNAKKDREFFVYLKKSIRELFDRSAYLKERPRYNSIELNFSHKELLKKMHEELDFPIGPKLDLKINEKIYNLGYEKMKYVIRGILDSDGCVYFDKTPVGRPYPCLNITMKAPRLMNQVLNMLLNQGFKARLEDRRYHAMQIILKGSKQLNKWIREIGSSNPRNLSKLALVAQLDSAAAS
jgi:hypothetical protein